MSLPFVSYEEAKNAVTWAEAVEGLRRGHEGGKADLGDLLFERSDEAMLVRGARLDGVGYAVKSETLFELNKAKGLPRTQGVVLLFSAVTGALRAIIDSRIVTELKTAAASVLGASLLARVDSRHLVIIGAGVVAGNLARAYQACFPGIDRISIWARRTEQAQSLALQLSNSGVIATAVSDLPLTLKTADIVATATSSRMPVLHGVWVQPGTHVDLVGAFTPDMREADDALMAGAKVFVDNHETTRNIGEIASPIKAGVVKEGYIQGDLFDLAIAQENPARLPGDITVFKNGGGAHQDLMICDVLARKLGL